MAYVDDPNKKQQQNTMNILQPGAGDTQTTQQGTQAPTSAPQPQTSGSSIQSAPSPRQQQKPSSGTFTNLQQYSQANQGGAQRMTQAATQQVGQQAKQIGQAAQQQAAKTQSDIAANQAKIAQEQQFARQQLEKAGTTEDTGQFFGERSNTLNEAGLARLGDRSEEFQTRLDGINNRRLPQDFGPNSNNARASAKNGEDIQALMAEFGLGQVYNPSESDFDRFRNIVTGQTQFNDVRDLDLSQQRVQAQQLEQQGQQAGTDAGRLNLLRQTLGKGREYSRGQAGLDSALIARDAEARQGLQQGVQQSAQQAQQTLTGITGDVSSRRQALQQLNQEYGAGVVTEGDQATSGVLEDVESGRVSQEEARLKLADDLGITEAQAEERMGEMAKQRLDLNAARHRNEAGGYHYGGALGYAGRGMDLSKEQDEALALAGVDPKLRMSEDEKAYYEANRKGSYKDFSSNRHDPFGGRTRKFDRSGGYIWDQGSLGYGLDANINRMLGGEASALQKGMGDEALARQLEMSAGDPDLYRNLFGGEEYGDANDLYAKLKAGEDINTQTAASREQAQRYNALQDLLKGRDGVGESGQRTLSMDRAGQAAQQQELLERAREEAIRKLGIK